MNARYRRLFQMCFLKEDAKKRETTENDRCLSMYLHLLSVICILHGLLSLSVDREYHSIISLRIFST